MLFDLIRF